MTNVCQDAAIRQSSSSETCKIQRKYAICATCAMMFALVAQFARLVRCAISLCAIHEKLRDSRNRLSEKSARLVGVGIGTSVAKELGKDAGEVHGPGSKGSILAIARIF